MLVFLYQQCYRCHRHKHVDDIVSTWVASSCFLIANCMWQWCVLFRSVLGHVTCYTLKIENGAHSRWNKLESGRILRIFSQKVLGHLWFWLQKSGHTSIKAALKSMLYDSGASSYDNNNWKVLHIFLDIFLSCLMKIHFFSFSVCHQSVCILYKLH